ncbi:MAG: hypothetical protein ACYS99_04230, partial [Planctomycetota bacterium]
RFLAEIGGSIVLDPDDEAGAADALETVVRGDGPRPVAPERIAEWSRASQAAHLACWLSDLVG